MLAYLGGSGWQGRRYIGGQGFRLSNVIGDARGIRSLVTPKEITSTSVSGEAKIDSGKH